MVQNDVKVAVHQGRAAIQVLLAVIAGGEDQVLPGDRPGKPPGGGRVGERQSGREETRNVAPGGLGGLRGGTGGGRSMWAWFRQDDLGVATYSCATICSILNRCS